MSYETNDTIAAVATAAGGAARGMVRVSGPRAIDVAAACFTPDDGRPLDTLRRATAARGRVRITLGEAAPRNLPCDLFLWPTRRSYTREPIAELHVLGSPPLVDAVLAAVCQAGARLAEPGEFTLRAFLAGRLDLTQAEAVLGVVDARGSDELDAALAQLAGGLSRPLGRLRDELVGLLAELEAGLDFADEDIQFISPDELRRRLGAAGRLLGDVAAQMASRLAETHADQVVLTGRPNVGKSSLFNALAASRASQPGAPRAARHEAIVSHQPGTTRDYLTATIRLDGLRCELVDTAGVGQGILPLGLSRRERELGDIDAAAQSMTAERRARAAVRVLCVEAPGAVMPEPSSCDVVALTKADLVDGPINVPGQLPGSVPVVATSSVTGQGLDQLCAVLGDLLAAEATATRGQIVAATADRCRESIRLAEAALVRAAQVLADGSGEELVAVELRSALDELGQVVGAVYTDDLLDRIFSTFCIGK